MICFKLAFLTGKFREQSELNTKLLWENPSPNVAFTAQNITSSSSGATSDFDLTKYRFALIQFRRYTSQDSIISATVSILSTRSMLLCIDGGKLRIREVSSISINGIQFADGYSYLTYGGSATNDNYYCIPVRIYGIK